MSTERTLQVLEYIAEHSRLPAMTDIERAALCDLFDTDGATTSLNTLGEMELEDLQRAGLLERIAREFSSRLLKQIGAANLKSVIIGNKLHVCDNVCASHEYCDANMPMSEAFQVVTGHEIDCQSEEDAALWSDAWDVAKKNRFYQP